MLLEAVFNGLKQLSRRTRLAQKAVNMSFIDRGNRRLQVRVSTENHSYGIRFLLPDPGEKLGSVHDRHAHVGNDQREGSHFAQ